MPKEPLFALLKPLYEMPAFKDLVNAAELGGVLSAYGLDDSQRIHMLCALQVKTGRPLLLVTANDATAQRATDDINQLIGGAVVLPSREVSFLRTAASSHEISLRRLEALGLLLTGKLRVLVAPADAIMYRLMPRDEFMRHIITVRAGMRLDPQTLLKNLVTAGYERVGTVEGRGQCALRGGIMDIYPVGESNAVRIEFFDDEVDSLRDFDIMTQRSFQNREEASIFPASEAVLRRELLAPAAERLAAAIDEVKRERKRASAEEEQRKFEEAFELSPLQELFAPDDEELDAMPSMWDLKTRAAPSEDDAQDTRLTGTARNFASRLDALRSDRAFDGQDALIHILYEDTELAFDYFDRPIVVMDQPEKLRERCENRHLEFVEHVKTALSREEAVPRQAELLATYDELLTALEGHSVLTLSPFMRTMTDFRPKELFKFDGIGATGYMGNMRELVRDVKGWIANGFRVALMAGGVARGQRLNKSLYDLGLVVPFEQEIGDLISEPRVILPSSLHHGFVYPEIKFAVVSESDIFGVSKHKSLARSTPGDKMAAFTELNIGDYVVHVNHGIGRYMGTVRLASDGTYRDFLHIQYIGNDKLYVPTDQMDRVQKYIGAEGAVPRLNKLSGGEWQRQKAKVKSSIQEIAHELLNLYAARSASKGYAFSKDMPWQREFEDSFPFEETPDQLKAIAEIKEDMERDLAMDRLLCGDVGYGKTEVALRAIFKAVMDGKQAALLAPTTILVQQHYATMMNRFDGFPVRVEVLSRFRTPAEQKKTIERLKSGELDVVVGTHRLLGKDVGFKNLGILVVDEEQRFGVKHKETIKNLKNNVDVLTLSATPIPRTLHMSMVGIRDMSLLQSPPEERYPVQTYVVEYSDGLVRDAILRELSREGQVYVLYNRVQSIEVMFTRLKKLVPEARIAVGHGQMREHALEDVMMDFYDGKFDVLLCSTIIEAGLDVPRANTLIVCDADRFGLAQLYQLRGRVGRSNRLAYAYLTVNPSKVLTEAADKRLNAIREFTEFGSGFRVAMRDMEIRGTGNLLGAQQSGHMAAIGYDLYVKMIEDSMRELRGDVSMLDIQTRVELRVDAYLPADYIQSDLTRIEMYKKIASIYDKDAREDLIEELIDRFGDISRPVLNLINIAHLKGACQKVGIASVEAKGAQIVMKFAPSIDVSADALVAALSPHQEKIKLSAGRELAIIYLDGKKPVEELLSGLVPIMDSVACSIEQSGSEKGT